MSDDIKQALVGEAATLATVSDPLLELLSAEDQALFKKPFAPLVRAGQFIGTGRNTTYKAAKMGHIPTVDVCGQKFVSTAWLWETWRRGRLTAAAA